jgi:hypothetical protein
MERFVIFKQLNDGDRVFRTMSTDFAATMEEALDLRDTTDSEYFVYGVKTKTRVFDTEVYHRHVRKQNEMKIRRPAGKP